MASWKDFLSWWLLMLVETASLNSQSAVANGCSATLASWGGDAIKVVEGRTDSNEVVMAKSGVYVKGMTIFLASASSAWYSGALGIRKVLSVAQHPSNSGWVVLTFDGTPLTTAVGDWCAGCAQMTSADAVLAMGTRCGYYAEDPAKIPGSGSPDNCHAFVYGICDPWANVFQATAGIVKSEEKIWMAEGRQLSPRSLPEAGWFEADSFPWLGEGWPAAWSIKQTANNISLVPTRLGGNSGTLFGDYLWGAADSIRLPWRGGSFGLGTYGGALSVNWFAASDSYFHYGSRLAYLI